MIFKHQVFEITIELMTGDFMWNRFIMGPLSIEKVLQLLDEEIKESSQHPLHRRYRALVADFGLPEGTQMECRAYGEKVGMIYVLNSPEVIQIEVT